jgi:hypothetical protein
MAEEKKGPSLRCPGCGEEVFLPAEACPKCGFNFREGKVPGKPAPPAPGAPAAAAGHELEPASKRKLCLLAGAAAAVILILFLTVVFSGSDKPAPGVPGAPASGAAAGPAASPDPSAPVFLRPQVPINLARDAVSQLEKNREEHSQGLEEEPPAER